MEDPTGSEWNGATLTNQRIHELFVTITECFITKDLSKWIIALESLNQELYGFETKEEKVQYRRDLENLADEINKQLMRPINPLTRDKARAIPFELIRTLQDMRYKLQVVFHRSGLQTQLKEDANNAFCK